MFRPKDLDFCFFDKCLGGVAQSTSGLLRRVTPALFGSLATKQTSRCSSLVYALLNTQQTAPERKRNASEADKQQANKEQTIVIRTAGGSTCPAATRLLGKPGLLHTSHSVCLCVRYQTPFSSRHESGPSLFLSTGKHLVGGQLPRVFFSALPGQSSDRPNLPPHQKTFDFQFPFASIRRAPSEACSGRGKRRIDHSTSKRSSKKLQRATITAFFLNRSLVVVHCDRS